MRSTAPDHRAPSGQGGPPGVCPTAAPPESRVRVPAAGARTGPGHLAARHLARAAAEPWATAPDEHTDQARGRPDAVPTDH